MGFASLTDLDPPPAPERRWPFYVAWTVGGLVVGAVLFNHLPASFIPAGAPTAAPIAVPAPDPAVVPTQAPGPPRLVIPLVQPVPLRDARVPLAPARP